MPLVEGRLVGRVLHLHLNSPGNLNALSSAMIGEISSFLEVGAGMVEGASVVLLTSAGRHFGAGHDLTEMSTGGCDHGKLFRDCSRMMQMVTECEVPVVAAVQGCAHAAGCQLAASCDVVLAADNARFATPGVKIGLFCSTPSVAVTRAVTPKVAAEMLYAARELTAAEALQAGLVSRVVPWREDGLAGLHREAFQTCHRIAESPREVLVAGKSLVRAQGGQELGAAYELASAAMERGMSLPCAREGVEAFLRKRAPCWAAEDSELERALALLPGGVAVVGASPDPSRPSHAVFRAVQARYPAHPVNPHASEVAGAVAYPSLAAVPGEFALVNIFRAPGEAAAEAVEEAIALARQGRGVRGVWLQEGVRAPGAEAAARAAGLVCVAGRCLRVELQRAAAGASGRPRPRL